MSRIVLATHNPHKVEEFQAIVAATRPDLEVVGYDGPEPVEDGVTFAANALIKARAAAAHTGLPALADDSGIAVDVLGGAPGAPPRASTQMPESSARAGSPVCAAAARALMRAFSATVTPSSIGSGPS